MVNPINIASFNYVDQGWAIFQKSWLTLPTAPTTVEELESYGYASALLGINATTAQQSALINNIAKLTSTPLGYGSTWSSILYFIMAF